MEGRNGQDGEVEVGDMVGPCCCLRLSCSGAHLASAPPPSSPVQSPPTAQPQSLSGPGWGPGSPGWSRAGRGPGVPPLITQAMSSSTRGLARL